MESKTTSNIGDVSDEYVMYILVNKDLKMKAGKIASQCCHSACKVVQIQEDPHESDGGYLEYLAWKTHNYGKIILKADQKTLEECIKKYSDKNQRIWCEPTFDLGRTQIEAGSLTTVAFTPMLKESAPEFIKHLKLL